MVPFKPKPNGMIKHTAVILILLCFSGSCFSFLQRESRRKLDGPLNDYHHQNPFKVEPRKVGNHEREIIVLSPYIRDVGADSRQSRIDARDIRTDFREIRTELGRRTYQNSDSRRPDLRILSDNTRSRFEERRDTEYPSSRLNSLNGRRDPRARLEPGYSRRNSLNNNRNIRETRDVDRRLSREYRLGRQDSRRNQDSIRFGNRFDQANNNIRTREVRDASRGRLNHIKLGESQINEYSAERRTIANFRRSNLLDNGSSRVIRRRTTSGDLNSRPTNIRDQATRMDGEGFRKTLLENVRSNPRMSVARREHRDGQENTRRSNIRSREVQDISDERGEFRMRRENNRRTSPNELRTRQTRQFDRTIRDDSKENFLSNTRSWRTSLSRDEISFRRASSLSGDKVHYNMENSGKGVADTIRNHDDRKNDTGSRFAKNTGNTRVAANNYNFIPSFNYYKSNILITVAQAALVIMLFGQILGNASKNKLRLTNWWAMFSKEKIA